MKNYRIVELWYDNIMIGKKRSYAVQQRFGIFFWRTMVKADSKSQCRTYIKNVRGKKEHVIRVLEYL